MGSHKGGVVVGPGLGERAGEAAIASFFVHYSDGAGGVKEKNDTQQREKVSFCLGVSV